MGKKQPKTADKSDIKTKPQTNSIESIRPITKDGWILDKPKHEQTVADYTEKKIWNTMNHSRIVSGTEAPETKDLIFAGEIYVEDPNLIKLPKQSTECPKNIL